MNPTLTPRFDGESLCLTCRAAQVVRGLRFDEDRVYCRALYPPRQMGAVRSCTTYDDKRTPSLHDFEMIAWQLVTDRTKGRIGFISAQELRERNGSPPVASPAFGSGGER